MLSDAFYIVILVAAMFAGRLETEGKRLLPSLTLILAAILAASLAFQLTHSWFLVTVERTGRELRAGQWWRLVTALFGQDGRLAGGLSNILFLLLLGRFAEPILGTKRWLFLYFGAGILTQFVALYLQPIGAGNSVANFGLAAGILVTYASRSAKASHQIPLAIALMVSLGLLLKHDIHGSAFLIGCVLAFISNKNTQ